MKIEQIFWESSDLIIQLKRCLVQVNKIKYSFTGCASFLNQCARTRLLTFDVLFMSVLTFKDLF